MPSSSAPAPAISVPGLTGYVIERLGLRPNTAAFDLVGQGCAAAAPNMRLAQALIGSRPDHSNVLSVCVEVSSAAMYLDDDPGVMVSACLFGDGAGAAVLSMRHRRVTAASSGRTASPFSIPRSAQR